MTALINTKLRKGDSFAGERTVNPTEGEALRAPRGGGGTMNRRLPLDSLPLRECFVRCFFCQQTVSREQLDGHYCPGSPW